MLRRPHLVPVGAALLLAACTAAESTGPEGDACQQAAAVIDDCGGDVPEIPPEGCVGTLQTSAEEIVNAGCAAVDGTDGKADSFWCGAASRWLGLCKTVPLAQVAALDGLDVVCPGSRRDDLCEALRDGDDAVARDVLRARVQTEPRQDVLGDPAAQYWIRERTTALLVWNVAETAGADPGRADFVDEVLSSLFPAYEPDVFAIAHRPMAPEAPGCDETASAAVLFFPGVVRLGDRNEFAEQRAAVEEGLPCLRTYLVDTGSFVEPSVNAQRGTTAFETATAELGPVPMHLVGYSQGASNALTALVDHPEIAERASTVLVMNAASRGSEVADTLGGLISALDGSLCERVPDFAEPACAWADAQSPVPSEHLMTAIAFAMGIPVDALAEFIAAEDDVATAPTVQAFFAAHTPGVQSLSTEVAGRFWRERADELPVDTMYYSFRSVISDPSANLPISNQLFFSLLERAGERVPYNDMQVRLENQHLGGPVAGVEVVGPVAEGNHWQWELATGAVPETVMPATMTDKIPHRETMLAYFQTLAELDLLLTTK